MAKSLAAASFFQKTSINYQSRINIPFGRRPTTRSISQTLAMAESDLKLRTAFDGMKKELKEIASLESIQNLLSWDQHVFMPEGGADARGDQMEAIARVVHQRRKDSKLGKWISMLAECPHLPSNGFSAMEAAAVREASRDYIRATRVPEEVQARKAVLEVQGTEAWAVAKKNNDFGLLAPVLEEWISLLKQEAAAVHPDMDPYNYLLDLYEKGNTREKMDTFFAALKEPLICLLKKIGDSSRGSKKQTLEFKNLTIPEQRDLAKKIAGDMGFKWENGRLDESKHPITFDISSPVDVRITSRYSETDLVTGLLAVVHEAGHALYEQGRHLEACQNGLPSSRPTGMGLHESQSLFWERCVAMSEEFWLKYWPIVVETYPFLSEITATDFYKFVNEVQPSLIRVDADEVSYPLHVLLRYEIEKGLFDGNLNVKDIPNIWNSKMKEYLGICPPSDTEGCLQDIHWGGGSFGYFPTYVMGAAYACQFFETACKELPDLKKNISEGKFEALREWLLVKIHSVGSLYETADELVESVTGRGLDPVCFLNSLSSKYKYLYELSD